MGPAAITLKLCALAAGFCFSIHAVLCCCVLTWRSLFLSYLSSAYGKDQPPFFYVYIYMLGFFQQGKVKCVAGKLMRVYE